MKEELTTWIFVIEEQAGLRVIHTRRLQSMCILAMVTNVFETHFLPILVVTFNFMFYPLRVVFSPWSTRINHVRKQ